MVKLKDLEEQVCEIITNYKEHPWRKTTVKIEKYKDLYDPKLLKVVITVSQPFSAIELKFSMLNELAHLFETDHINLREHYGHYGDNFTKKVEGCDSCEYGSHHTIKIAVSNYKINIEGL